MLPGNPATARLELPERLQQAEERVGAALGKWRLEQLLGVGPDAAVYEARHRNQKRAAIKVLHPELSTPALRDGFVSRAYRANLVGHPGAVRVDDDDMAEDGTVFLVMELVEGETVQARWECLGFRCPPSTAFSIADQLLEILTNAHQNGVVHGSLRPQKLHLTRDGSLKVTDFGLGNDSRVDEPGTGGRTFLAPEQLRGRWEEVDATTDLWAVGAILFTLITGRHVYDLETPGGTLILSQTSEAPSIRSLDSSLPRAAAAVVDRALAVEKSDRFPDAASMRQAVRLALHSLPCPVAPGSSVPPAVHTPSGTLRLGQDRSTPAAPPSRCNTAPGIGPIAIPAGAADGAASPGCDQGEAGVEPPGEDPSPAGDPPPRLRRAAARRMLLLVAAALFVGTALVAGARRASTTSQSYKAVEPRSRAELGAEQRSSESRATRATPSAGEPTATLAEDTSQESVVPREPDPAPRTVRQRPRATRERPPPIPPAAPRAHAFTALVQPQAPTPPSAGRQGGDFLSSRR